MRISLLFNERPAYAGPGLPDDTFEEYDDPATIRHVATALERLGMTVEPVAAGRALPGRLEAGGFDFAFNIAEGPVGLAGAARRCREGIAPSVCELLGIPYTGSDPLTLGITLDKAMARRMVSPEVPVAPGVLLPGSADTRFRGHGHVLSSGQSWPQPDSCGASEPGKYVGELAPGRSPAAARKGRPHDRPHTLLSSGDRVLSDLKFPVIVKPNDEGSSKGIHGDNLANDSDAAMALARRLSESYACPVLVEEFLPGAEVTVGLAGNPPEVRLLGMMEIAPAHYGGPFVHSLEVKRDFRRRVEYHVPPRLDAVVREKIERYARAAYGLLGCRDIARIDFRLDAEGEPCFIECNPLPGLNPDSSEIVILTAGKLSYDELVQGILLDAMNRTGVRAS